MISVQQRCRADGHQADRVKRHVAGGVRQRSVLCKPGVHLLCSGQDHQGTGTAEGCRPREASGAATKHCGLSLMSSLRAPGRGLRPPEGHVAGAGTVLAAPDPQLRVDRQTRTDRRDDKHQKEVTPPKSLYRIRNLCDARGQQVYPIPGTTQPCRLLLTELRLAPTAGCWGHVASTWPSV